MDPGDLLDYALGRLEGPRRKRIERRIVSDPKLAERVARLIRNIGRLLDDGQARRPLEGAPPPSTSPVRPDPGLWRHFEERGNPPPDSP